ncbi:hypothetical protein FRB96_002103 [Tulasnella sp. 330]|nr:hypothetical protein FRB96_002103 [Tulasnella sp. 330]
MAGWGFAMILGGPDTLTLLETSEAPVLKTLHLTSAIEDWMVAADLFKGDAPKLSELSLQGNSLRASPALRMLSLNHVAFEEDEPEVTDKDMALIQLPLLTSITIRKVHPNIAAVIVLTVDIPSCQNWVFGSDKWGDSALVVALAERMAPVFHMQPDWSLHLGISRDKVEVLPDIYTSGSPYFGMYCDQGGHCTAERRAMAALGTAVDGIAVKQQFNHIKRDMDSSKIRSLLQIVPNITELVIVGIKDVYAMRALLKELSESHASYSSEFIKSWACPNMGTFLSSTVT